MAEINRNISGDELLSNAVDNAFGLFIQQYNICNEQFSELSVHDIRVSIRRFQTCLALIGYLAGKECVSEVKAALKPQINILDRLRDTQVQIIKVRQMVFLYPVLYRYFHHLLNNEEAIIYDIKDKVRSFDIRGLEKKVLTLKVFLKKYAAENKIYYQTLMHKAYQKYINVNNRFEKADKENPTTIHKVRLAFKKFRYTLEIVQPITNMTSEESQELNDFQTIMGSIQDLCVFLNNLNEFSQTQEEVSTEMFKPVEKGVLLERERMINEFFSGYDKIHTFWKSEYLT